MLNQIFVVIALSSCVVLFGYLAYWGWKDMKDHEPKKKN